MGMGGLKMPKDDLGGVFRFLLNIKGPDFDSVLRKVLYCVILKQFHQHFGKEIQSQIVGASTQHSLL